MASHFSDIGFAIGSSAEILALSRTLRADTPAFRTAVGTYYRYAVGGGAELWFQADPDMALVGMNPHFDAQTPTPVRLTARQPDEKHALDGAFHLWLNPPPVGSAEEAEGIEGDTPLLVDVPDYRAHDDLELPANMELAIAGFAHTLEVYATEAEMHATGSKMSHESLIPSGLFIPGGEVKTPARADAILYGTVEATELRRNGSTGVEFVWARVRTYGGRLEIVADRALAPTLPVVGGIVGGAFWMSARVWPGEG